MRIETFWGSDLMEVQNAANNFLDKMSDTKLVKDIKMSCSKAETGSLITIMVIYDDVHGIED